MKLTLLIDMLIGDTYYLAGSAVDVEEVRARRLIYLGHAQLYVEQPDPIPAPIPAPIPDPQPTPETPPLKKGK